MNDQPYNVLATQGDDAHTDAIVPDGDSGGDFRLTSTEGAWITYRNLSVKLTPTDEGLVCDIYPVGGEATRPLASTYAFFQEAIDQVADEEDGTVPEGVDERAAGVLALREISESAARAHAELLNDVSKAWVIAQLEADEDEEAVA